MLVALPLASHSILPLASYSIPFLLEEFSPFPQLETGALFLTMERLRMKTKTYILDMSFGYELFV